MPEKAEPTMTHTRFRLTALAGVTLLALPFTAAADLFDSVVKTEGADLKSFEQIYIAPVEFDLDPDTRRRVRTFSDTDSDPEISERDQTYNAKEFEKDLRSAFARKFTLVEAPGEDVLTVDATITRLTSSRPTTSQRRRSLPLQRGASVSAGAVNYYIELRSGDDVLAEIKEDDPSSLSDGITRVGTWQDAESSYSRMSRKLVRYTLGN
ncbi:MAG: DUF3313 family protein [Pseudomonadota bacterium]